MAEVFSENSPLYCPLALGVFLVGLNASALNLVPFKPEIPGSGSARHHIRHQRCWFHVIREPSQSTVPCARGRRACSALPGTQPRRSASHSVGCALSHRGDSPHYGSSNQTRGTPVSINNQPQRRDPVIRTSSAYPHPIS